VAQLELLDFQQVAADKLVKAALDYYQSGPDRVAGKDVPFVGQLKAVTGAGKTPILANVIGRMSPSIILWTTKFGSVVDQTVANLGHGGKYHHLLRDLTGGKPVEIVKFGDIHSPAEWQHILDRTDGLTILISTVAAWNSLEKDERLNVHRINPDWNDKKSRWDQLTTERKRPLWIVYDEGHNTTTDQVDLLDDLDPAGFFVASASPIKGKLQLYQTNWPAEVRQQRIVPVSTRAVVDAQLLKSTISLADYDSSTEEMLGDVVRRRDMLEQKLTATPAPPTPKAIYVVETSNATADGGEPRPSAIWKTLVNTCGIAPEAIAICTNTKTLPKGAVRVENINQLSDRYTHIIFNKKLQEGWDDPSVYVCYFDGKTDSATRVQQVLGRALRQPKATHFSDEDLNTAYFFVNCPNEALEKITDQLKEELRIYKGDDAPDDFEPFQFKEERTAPPRIDLKPEYVGDLKAPRLQPALPSPMRNLLPDLIKRKTYDFGDADRAAPGRALVNIVSVRTGDVEQNTRDLLEDMRIRCGRYLQEQIGSLSRSALNSMHLRVFSNDKLDKTACYRSRALEHYRELAVDVVREYENHVQLGNLADTLMREYEVGAYQPRSATDRPFNRAGHPYYDAKSFNDDELSMAKALDRFLDYVWVRNKEKRDYAIPLPIKSDSGPNFWPDFLWWVKDTVWAIDPTGKFILQEKIRTKLLTVPAPLRIALITHEKLDSNYKSQPEPGWTLLRHRLGNAQPETFDSLDVLLATLVAES